MKNKVIIVAGTVFLLVALFLVGTFIYKNQESGRLSFIASENFKTFVPDYAPVKGNEDAKVHVVEFLDPECESCREFHPYTKMLLNEYEGKLKLVVRYAPFHQNSIFVVKVLEAARKQDKYWQALDVLFQYQPYWGSHHNPRPDLIWNYLPQIGLDVEQLKKDMQDPEIQARIDQDIKDGAQLGVRATPTFFVNGKALESFGPEQLKNKIEEEVKANYPQ